MTSAACVLRQVLVLGEAGQAQVSLTTAHVSGDGFAGDVEALYAERAGFARVVRERSSSVSAPSLSPADEPSSLETRTARELLAGARAVVRAIQRAADGASR